MNSGYSPCTARASADEQLRNELNGGHLRWNSVSHWATPWRAPMGDKTIENKEGVFGTAKNEDGSPVQEVRDDGGKKTAEISNKEGVFGTAKNEDGSPVKEVTSE
jgi:hypothetical protein